MSKYSHLTPDERQALKAVKAITDLGVPRHGNKSDGKFHSVGSARNAKQTFKLCSAFCREYGFTKESFKSLTVQTAEKYLQHRAEKIQQKQLNIERNALNKHLSKVHNKPIELPFQNSYRATSPIVNRAYSHDQVKQLIDAAVVDGKRDLAVSIAIAYNAGLRAEELHTIAPPGSSNPSNHRTWSVDIYTGRESWTSTTVNGKGGLVREIRYTPEFQKTLATYRREMPTLITDRARETKYESHYKLIAGQKFSKAFGALSQKVFGWSNGAHGLRHSFAQRRLIELKNHFQHDHARKVLAQELGHFDTSNLVYYGV